MDIHVIDEHHEAYLIIEKAFRKGMLKGPATLVHVDSHNDLCTTRTQMSCYDNRYRLYVEKHLDIGNYLAPLLLRRRLKRILYINNGDREAVRRNVGSVNGEGRIILFDIPRDVAQLFPDKVNWTFKESTDIGRAHVWTGSDSCILDIDMDYFSNNHLPSQPFKIKYTRKQKKMMTDYQYSNDDLNIKLRVLNCYDGNTGKNHFVFNNSWEWIKLCIDYFTRYLHLEPRLIIISRSEKSGFTPQAFRKRIEARIVSQLTKPPEQIVIPGNLKPVYTDHIIRKRDTWFNKINGNSYSITETFGEDARGVFRMIDRRKKLVKIFEEYARKYYYDDESKTLYNFLRLIFNMRRYHVIE